jgi:purine-nucleoside phosphorylase
VKNAKRKTRRKHSVRSTSPHGFDQALQATGYIKSWGVAPKVAVILGSGLNEVVGWLEAKATIPYAKIPHFPLPTVQGHQGSLHLGKWNGVPVAILSGRVHGYEGHAPDAVVFPVRALALAGVETFILTCAAGGIAPRLRPGDFMVFRDHLNLQGVNPLAGTHDLRWGTQFVDMTEPYCALLRATARNAARKLRLRCFPGVYASLPGPSYETPAEIRALKRLGADAVGMSTVSEVLAARQRGCRVLAVATITNRAAGLGDQPLSHDEVLAEGRAVSSSFGLLLDRILNGLRVESQVHKWDSERDKLPG